MLQGQRERFLRVSCSNDFVVAGQIQPQQTGHGVVVIYDQQSSHFGVLPYDFVYKRLAASLPASTGPASRAWLFTPSRTSRTFRISVSSVKGLFNRDVPGSRTPCPAIKLSVYPDMYSTFIPGFPRTKCAASTRPFIPGITTSVSNNWIGSGSCKGACDSSSPSPPARKR